MTTLPTLRPSARVTSLKPSATVAFTNRAKQRRDSGGDVLIFAAGEPDFDTPQPIKDAAIAALLAGETRYMPTLGDMKTRDTIAAKLRAENGVGRDPAHLGGHHVAISAGGKHTLYVALHCLLDDARTDPDLDAPQEVLLPVPAWVSYAPMAEIAGGRVVEIPTAARDDFKLSPARLADAITPHSRVLILNSPSNPCGTMYTPDELRALAAVIAERADAVAPHLVVISDEIYEKITYGTDPATGARIEHLSIGSIPSIADRTLTVNGMSKAFAMTGWRIGYAAMPGDCGRALINAMGVLQGQMTTNITSFNYAAIRAALTDPRVAESVETMRLAFAARARLIHGRLAQIPGVCCPTPTGAFYVFPEVRELFGRTSPAGAAITDATTLCNALLDEEGVAFVPGDDFGGCGPDHVRISFACSEQDIEQGMDRFARFVSRMG